MASALRQRFLGDTSRNTSSDNGRNESPSPAVAKVQEGQGDEYNIIPRDALKTLRKKAKGRRPWRRYVSTFSLGGVFALVAAAFFSTPKGSLDKLVSYAGLEGMSLDSIMDVLPAGLIRDVSALQVSRSSPTIFWRIPRSISY
jgi:phospholipid:diacylglycerol acyltransferase